MSAKKEKAKLRSPGGREDHGDDGHDLRGHDRGGDALQNAGANQRLDGRSDAAEGRGEREGTHAGEEHAAAPDDVAQAPAWQQEEGEAQHIGGDHPLDVTGARAEIALQRWQGHVDDADIDEIHEAGEQQDGKCHPSTRVGLISRKWRRGLVHFGLRAGQLSEVEIRRSCASLDSEARWSRTDRGTMRVGMMTNGNWVTSRLGASKANI